jgi:hypothetical protein
MGTADFQKRAKRLTRFAERFTIATPPTQFFGALSKPRPPPNPKEQIMTHATHAQQLKWANEDVAERKAATDLHFPDHDHQWPLDPSASPSSSNIEFYQKRGE